MLFISGYGLAQWTDAGRKTKLYDYAKDVLDVNIDDEYMQIEYLLGELGYGPASGYAYVQIKSGMQNRGHKINSWYDATSDTYDYEVLKEATNAFCHIFERPTDEDEDRADEAIAIYNIYHGSY